MSQYARPAFSAPKRTPDYYIQCRAFIESLRSTTTMREIASLLNRAGYTTPTGLQFSKQTVLNMLRKKST